jgi:hypothetical protein
LLFAVLQGNLENIQWLVEHQCPSDEFVRNAMTASDDIQLGRVFESDASAAH